MTALYEQDLHAWSLDQAERLRHARDSGSNLDLDWDHLIEEVEALAGSQRRALTSNLMRVLEHLAKLRYSAALRPRAGWERSLASPTVRKSSCSSSRAQASPTPARYDAAGLDTGAPSGIQEPDARSQFADLAGGLPVRARPGA
jgi:hypothetical protein